MGCMGFVCQQPWQLPTAHVFGTRGVCDAHGVCEKCGSKGGIYVLADGVRVSDHAEVSLWACHGHCSLCISTVSDAK
jgi:hypothetical protein